MPSPTKETQIVLSIVPSKKQAAPLAKGGSLASLVAPVLSNSVEVLVFPSNKLEISIAPLHSLFAGCAYKAEALNIIKPTNKDRN